MIELVQSFFDTLDRSPWWLWPACLLGMGVLSIFLSLFFQPMGMSWVQWPWGGQLGDTCGMIVATGLPCPQCGMTRSWVHGIRGDLQAAFTYNAAGLALLGWTITGGAIGAVRLITRNPKALQPPTWLLFGWISFWLVPLYLGGYVHRLMGYNPLP